MASRAAKCGSTLITRGERVYGAMFRALGDPKKQVTVGEIDISSDGDSSDGVLLRVIGAPINPSDTSFIRGIYAKKPDFSKGVEIPGYDGALEVVRAGRDAEKAWSPGDWALLSRNAEHNGMWKSHIVARAQDLIKINTEKNLNAAVALRVNGMTAFRLAGLISPGDCAIITGGNSSCGQLIIQFARSRGAECIAIVRDRESYSDTVEALKRLGAAAVIRPEDLAHTDLPSLTSSRKAPTVAIDCVAGDLATTLIRKLAYGGTYVCYGAMSYHPITVPPSSLFFNNVIVRGFWLSDPNSLPSSKSEQLEYDDLVRTILEHKIIFPELEFVHVPRDPERAANVLAAALEPAPLAKKQALIFDEC